MLRILRKTQEQSHGVNEVRLLAESGDRVIFKRADIANGTINVAVLADGRKVGVVYSQDRYLAYSMQCPHLGGDLSVGCFNASEHQIECPWHGYLFDVHDGRCVRNPNVESLAVARVKSAHFDPYATPAYRLRSYPTKTVGEEIHVQIR